MRMSFCFTFAATALSVAFLGCHHEEWCGGNPDRCASGGASGPVGSSSTGTHTGATSTGTGASCAIDPPGTAFTFHVTNTGTRQLRLTYGCSATLPITLTVAQGTLGISQGPANSCEHDCSQTLAGNPDVCSDCGPGYGAALGPGQTADIKWDRRVFIPFTVDPSCSHMAANNNCALGMLVKDTMASGKLTICNAATGVPGQGYCDGAHEETVPFQVDLTKTETTIDVK